MIGREWSPDPEDVFWHWPIAKCLTLLHVYFFTNNVTCEPAVESQLGDELAAIYAHDNRRFPTA